MTYTYHEHELIVASVQYQAIIRRLINQQMELNFIVKNLQEADLKEIGITYAMKINSLTNEFIVDVGKLFNTDDVAKLLTTDKEV